MRILDRYVLKEMLWPFLISVFAFVVMWLGRVIYDSMDIIIMMRPSLSLVLRLVVYRFPWVLGMSLPLATLFAASLSVNRLAHDSEVTAMRMAGTPLRRIFAPVLVVGLLASGLTFWLDETITPKANAAAQKTMMFIMGQQRVPPIQENVFFQSEGYYFYVQRVDRSNEKRVRLERVMIYEPPVPGGYPMLVTAGWAESRSNVWSLHECVLHKLGSDGLTQYEMKSPEMTLNLKRAEEDMWDTQRQSEEMNMKDLQREISLFAGSGREATKLKVDWHFKLSLPLACFIFALCAAPLGCRFSRMGSYSGILLSIVIMFLYWNIILLGQYLGKGGVVPPFLAGWSQNILFGLIGIYMIWREE